MTALGPARGHRIVVLVIDNDVAQSARAVVADFAAGFPWPARYCVEDTRGLSHVRNRAVREALALQADFVAFIDDDELVSGDWLEHLLAVQREYAADVVTGPVVPRYDPGVPGWVVAGGFFERPRHATGTRLESARSGNCLIRSTLLNSTADPFDARFAFSGGEDTHFFRRVRASGAVIVWADGAVVTERVPASRGRLGWLLRRAYAGGSSFTVSQRLDAPPIVWVASALARGIARSLEGTLLLGPGLVGGRASTTRALQRVSVGLGALAGLIGRLPEPYRGGDDA